MMEQELPSIDMIGWLRGSEVLDLVGIYTLLNYGLKGSGKSSLLEVQALPYPKIIDLFGSRDNEGLAWCRSPFGDKVCFLVGDSVDVESSWDCIRISDLRLGDFERDYKVFLTANCFYGTQDQLFWSLNKIIEILYQRMYWREPWFLMIREAANFIYSRLKLTKNQDLAKADFLYLLREMRHIGYAVGVDTIRWTSVDKEIRDVSDYIFIKKVGIMGLPRDLRFVYKYVDPYTMMNPRKDYFVVVSNKGGLGVGRFDYPTWHKEEGENILGKLGIRIEHGDVPDYGDQGRSWVSDFEHADIVAKYMEYGSMRKVAQLLCRSSGTVQAHVKEHNDAVEKYGECHRCVRIRGKDVRRIAQKEK